jgi:two-component system phosphate regulon response regulator OmpR
MSKDATILVVDDDEAICELLEDFLGEQGYQVISLNSAEALRLSLEKQMPDLVLLDVGLPGEDGLSLARHIREKFNLGIIMVSGAGETMDRIIGLEVGADDYIAKPFDLRELHARIKSVMRRYKNMPAVNNHDVGVTSGNDDVLRSIQFGIGRLDLQRRQLFDEKGAEIPITAMEFELLRVFSERPDRPLSRDQLLNLTQNRDWDPYDRSIDIRIARLRKKIEPDPDKPVILRTVRGMGYMFVPRD